MIFPGQDPRGILRENENMSYESSILKATIFRKVLTARVSKSASLLTPTRFETQRYDDERRDRGTLRNLSCTCENF